MTALEPVPPFIVIARDETMRTNVLSGRKQITIRKGHRDFRPGPAMICDHIVPWIVQVTITEVVHKSLGEVTEEEWKADCFTSREDLLQGMRVFYPNLTLESPVTIIHWGDPSGAWVDEYRRSHP